MTVEELREKVVCALKCCDICGDNLRMDLFFLLSRGE